MSRERRKDEARSSRVVLITGASSGIGAATALEAAYQGYTLAVTARRGDRLEELAAKVRAIGGEILSIPAALEDSTAPGRIVDEVVGRFGRLDVLVNNAGFGLPSLFEGVEPEELRRQIDVNLVAPLMLARYALPQLLERRGVVINIGSAITCVPNSALGAYGATKAGLAYWSLALHRELRHRGVNVCLVEPGPVHTEFFDAFTRLGAHPGTYHPMLDSPAPWMSAEVGDVARQVVKLIERPRSRLSVPKRFVWPWRVFGGLLRLVPGLGDAAVSSVVRHYAGVDPRTITRPRSLSNAAQTE